MQCGAEAGGRGRGALAEAEGETKRELGAECWLRGQGFLFLNEETLVVEEMLYGGGSRYQC